MSWGTRHDESGARGPSGEPCDDDGAGNPLPREVSAAYGSDDEEAGEMPDPTAEAQGAPDDWTRADSDEARF